MPVDTNMPTFRSLFGANLIIGATACAPVLNTQQQRLTYLRNHVDENLSKTMQCDKTELTFKSSEQKGTQWFDTYRVEGCGQSSDYVTMINPGERYITWAFGLAPTEEEYRLATENQLAAAARFELGCDSLKFVVLNGVIAPLRTVYESTVGAEGCGKKTTYRSQCGVSGFAKGKNEIACRILTSGSGGN